MVATVGQASPRRILLSVEMLMSVSSAISLNVLPLVASFRRIVIARTSFASPGGLLLSLPSGHLLLAAR